MTYINADLLDRHARVDIGDTVIPLGKLIDAMPQVEIVRCRECKHREDTDCRIADMWCMRCVAPKAVKPDDYCSYGER